MNCLKIVINLALVKQLETKTFPQLLNSSIVFFGSSSILLPFTAILLLM